MRLSTTSSSLLAVVISRVLATPGKHDNIGSVSVRGGPGAADYKIQNYVFNNIDKTANANVLLSNRLAMLPTPNLTWNQTDTALVINKVELWTSDSAFAIWEGTTSGPKGYNNKGVKRASGSDDIIALNYTAGTNMLPLDINLNEDQKWDQHFNQVLYAKLSWFIPGDQGGWSKSSPFAIAKDSASAPAAADIINQALAGGLVLPDEGTDSSASPSTPTQSTTIGSSTTQTASSSSPAAQSNVISNGAIAGIVIGAVAGLALIGGLVWFFCFRRRKQQTQSRDLGYGHDGGAAAMIADKEQPGISESSPHSAYGDDGGRLHDRGSAVVDPAYMPYSDHAPQAHNTPPAAHIAPAGHANIPPQITGGTQSTSQENSTSYAHLVEEGMTPEEIRRLEEEERALDQAIDAAGHNRGGAH